MAVDRVPLLVLAVVVAACALALALMFWKVLAAPCKHDDFPGVPEPYTPPLPALPSSPDFAWVTNRKWVAFYNGVYRAHVFGGAYPAWPNPTDRLLSNTQKAALDPVHAFKLRQVVAVERACAAPGGRRCVASETAARVADIWATRYSSDAVRGMYASVDAYLLPSTLPDI